METPEEKLPEAGENNSSMEEPIEPVNKSIFVRIGKRVLGIIILIILGIIALCIICTLQLWGAHPG